MIYSRPVELLRDQWWWLRNRQNIMEVMGEQASRIMEMHLQIDRDNLTYTKNQRDVIAKFRVYLEDPREDIREALEEALRDLDDTVARAEEHILP